MPCSTAKRTNEFSGCRSRIQVAGKVFDVVFSRDGSRFATGSTYNLVKLWDARTTEPLETATLVPTSNAVSSVIEIRPF